MNSVLAPGRLRPVRAVYLLAMVTVIAILMLVASLLLSMRTRDLARAHRETVSLVRMLSAQTEQSFRGADMALKGVQDRMQSPYGSQLMLDSMPVHLLLSTRSSGLRQVRALFIVDPEGRINNASASDLNGKRWNVSSSDFKAMSRVAPSRLYISGPVQMGKQGTWTLYLARRIEAADGSFRGVAVAAMNLKYFENYYGYMEQGFLRPIGLYHDDATLIASIPHRSQALGRAASELRGVDLTRTGSVPVEVAATGEDPGKNGLVLAQVPDFPLLVAVRENDMEVLAAWRHAAIPVLLGTALVCVFIGIAAFLLGVELRREGKLSSALREADDRYRLTMDSVMDAIISVNDQQQVVMFNTAAERMFGIPAKDAIGIPLARLLPARYRHNHDVHVWSFMHASMASRNMALQTDIHGLRADGSEFPIESAVSKTLIEGKPQLTAVLRDVTERRRKDAELREINTELRRLSAALQNVRDEERTRISRELHDDLGQQLTGLKLELTWFSGRLKEGRRAATDMLVAMHEMLDRAITSVRRISTELRPWVLEDRDLGEALAWQVEEITRHTNISYQCNLPAAHLVQDEALATAIFRMVQEALSNVVRHARSSWLAVQLEQHGDDLVVTVRDTGCGFVHDHGGGGIGLVSMRERASALGGTFRVISEPDKGTTIEIHIPLVVRATVREEA
ncbi:histidine kinase [Oleiagrimonas sp.]|jgi:PAS domain S-box-containing protein|uniref:histidine kinase n=1 Tax=Oleiagrimonas sp. TaxID=2010330 RepID=UPI00260DDD00|nr:histidine kinase [Oleiagrimonas sp.]MDA3913455.1 histidine kinase [Oleiagrimonas sp.]